jgi:hypothetical protein
MPMMRLMSSWLMLTMFDAPEPIGPNAGPGASVLASS